MSSLTQCSSQLFTQGIASVGILLACANQIYDRIIPLERHVSANKFRIIPLERDVSVHNVWQEFEDTKGVTRIRISKNRQHNGQKKKYKRTNNDLQNIHIKLKIE